MSTNPKIQLQRNMLLSKYDIDLENLIKIEKVIGNDEKIKALYEILLSDKYNGKVSDTTIILLSETFQSDISVLDDLIAESIEVLPQTTGTYISKLKEPELNSPSLSTASGVELLVNSLFNILVAIALSAGIAIGLVYIANQLDLIGRLTNIEPYDLDKRKLISTTTTYIITILLTFIYLVIDITRAKRRYSRYLKGKKVKDQLDLKNEFGAKE